MRSTKSVSLRLSPPEIKKLKDEAAKEFRTLASYLEKIVMTRHERL